MCISVVLSSDDEESSDIPQHCSPAVDTQVTVEDTVKQGQASQEADTNQQEATDVHDMQVWQNVFICYIWFTSLQYNRIIKHSQFSFKPWSRT